MFCLLLVLKFRKCAENPEGLHPGFFDEGRPIYDKLWANYDKMNVDDLPDRLIIVFS